MPLSFNFVDIGYFWLKWFLEIEYLSKVSFQCLFFKHIEGAILDKISTSKQCRLNWPNHNTHRTFELVLKMMNMFASLKWKANKVVKTYWCTKFIQSSEPTNIYLRFLVNGKATSESCKLICVWVFSRLIGYFQKQSKHTVT